jgi:1-acyl-sn-glycerol-3-phosphate acyltransferase
LLQICEVIPVRRGKIDIAALREAIRLVQNGELVGIFPEGRINESKQLLLPGRSGVAMIALDAQSPVIPCFIDGAPYDGTTLGCLFMPATVRLNIGRPIDLSAYANRAHNHKTWNELTDWFLREIAQLSDPSRHPADVGDRPPR